MDIIPVIDLKGGTVVHARRGQRDLYRPIQTPLAASSNPADVVGGLLGLHPFTTFYVADIDAITGAGDNRTAVARIKQAFPHVRLWVDSGVANIEAAVDWLAQSSDFLVVGSETLRNAAMLDRFGSNERVVLSLDFRGTDFQGPPDLLTNADHWPARVIVMTLDRVGSHTGPDFARLQAIKAMAATRKLYAAGGVRGLADLCALAQAGIGGALVASCLHSGDLTAADLARLSSANTSGEPR
ncbi:MAG TPA: HisA/HisF-related TIM barrel protein [Pseudolabrys sp.]|nr:HisA/HisF-related TIM barrel protein [Pseudolabrys sp.]